MAPLYPFKQRTIGQRVDRKDAAVMLSESSLKLVVWSETQKFLVARKFGVTEDKKVKL